MNLDPPILGYYAEGREHDRLLRDPRGVLERLRTWGAGIHAGWLARRGYRVELFDPIPLHVDQAIETTKSLPAGRGFSAEAADARDVPRPDGCADVVLLLGPLYHLVEMSQRRIALSEALRLLRPGGLLVASGISRFAWAFDAYRQRFASEPEVHDSIAHTLETGRSTADPGPESFWAHFHRAAELQAEVESSGFHHVEAYGVEGFGWLLPDLDEILADALRQERFLGLLRALEREPRYLACRHTCS